MKRICFCNLLLVSVLANSAVAETNAPPPPATNAVTIDALVRETLENNPELAFYRAEIAAAKAARKSAGLLANPEINGTIGHKTAQDRSSGMIGEGVAWSVSVVQPFEWPGRLGLRKAIANRDLELAELGFNRFRVALAARMRSLAWGSFAAREKALAAREVADRFKALREVLVQREPAGLTPLLETRVIEATELTMQRKASAADLASRSSLLELNQLRGVAPDAPILIAPVRLAFRAADLQATLLALARTNNFELQVRAVELAQQGFRVALAKNERYPSIRVGPSYSEETALERERTIGLGVSFPLPFWNRNSSGIATATARQLQAETSYAVAERELERKVLQAALTYETRRDEMAQWRPDAIAHFREAAETADRHYRLGAVPVSVYVELQKQYFEAVESLLDTKQEALEAAQNLELLTGLTPPLTSTEDSKP